MLSIPQDFLEEEYRIDFHISNAMKRAWAVQLTMLNEILEIANKHGIKIWLDYGTLLGAVRHHGYVPWDDDIDISVMRNDYVPLIMYLKEELPPYRDIMSVYTNPKFNQPKTVISCRKSLDIGNNPIEKKITDLHYGFPCSTWIDLYPMDYVPDDNGMRKTIITLYQAAHNIALGMDQLIATGEFEDDLSQLEAVVGTKVKRDENIRASIWLLSEKIASMAKKKESSNIAWYHDCVNASNPPMRPIAAYSKTLMVPFEMITAPIPVGYDTILRSTYGNGYLRPIKGTAIHDYPHFIGNERLILAYSKTGQLGDIF